ncbi:MAG: hypothetical protein JST51_17165 [Armatimonadetes bacterium]|nr:hypothetical protein [Armatimonadota bacterium]
MRDMVVVGEVSVSNRVLFWLGIVHSAMIVSPYFVCEKLMHGVWDRDMWSMFAVAQSAALFYGADYMSGPFWVRVITSAVYRILVACFVGGLFWRFGYRDVFFWNGTCLPTSGPSLAVVPQIEAVLLFAAPPCFLLFAGFRRLKDWPPGARKNGCVEGGAPGTKAVF